MSTPKPPLLPDATRDLARFGSRLRYDHLPAEVVARIKSSVIDSLGCCLFGATLPWTRKVAELADLEGARPEASLIGMGRKTSVSLAALVNGTSGHAFELDDIHKESVLHPGTLATPVALALAESRAPVSGRDFVTAMAAGFEIGLRVGNAATMSLFLRGFHPQGTSGTFVAAGTAAHLLGLDEGRFQHALALAGSQGCGLMAAQEGAMVKRFHCGRAAQSGIYSARLAANDFTGIPDVLEAPYGGFLASYSDKPDPARLTAGLGSTWETLQVGYKPYASVTSIHSALDGMLAILREEKLTADDIAEVHVGLSPMTRVHCAWEYKAQGVTAAQMNLYYGMAMVALEGELFTRQFQAHRLADPRTLDFIKRVTASVDPEIESLGPVFRHASRVRVKTRDGRTVEKLLLHRRGSPENPITEQEVRDKFRAVVAPCMKAAVADHIVELVDRLETLPSLALLVEAVAAPIELPKSA